MRACLSPHLTASTHKNRKRRFEARKALFFEETAEDVKRGVGGKRIAKGNLILDLMGPE